MLITNLRNPTTCEKGNILQIKINYASYRSLDIWNLKKLLKCTLYTGINIYT